MRQGAGVFGWAAALTTTAGPYRVVGADTLQEAMRIAARAIGSTGGPSGLLVWQGRHAWVMSGFEATGDPRDGSFRVTRAYILDPLHPHGSQTWGPSPKPGTSISVATVGRQFVRRRIHSQWNQLPGMARAGGQVRPGRPDGTPNRRPRDGGRDRPSATPGALPSQSIAPFERSARRAYRKR